MGKIFWVGLLQDASVSRQEAARHSLTLAGAYQQVLIGRAVDAAGKQAWLNLVLDRSASAATVGQRILASDEYFVLSELQTPPTL